MIKTLRIENFKSIKNIELSCNKINIFIGEPNTGKSNILESLGILSYGHFLQYESDAHSFVRYEKISNLFYDEEIENQVAITADNLFFTLVFAKGRFIGDFNNEAGSRIGMLRGDYSHFNQFENIHRDDIKFYRYQELNSFPKLESDYLLPSSGQNLQSLLSTHKKFRTLVINLISPYGLTLGIRPQEHKIEFVKKEEDAIISYPYSMVSETFRRLIFHMMAVLSNKDSTIILEEPEAHSFPLYVKYLAEKIAGDLNNQYFIATHNPYFLLSIMEKAFKDDVNIFITSFDNYQTNVKLLSNKKKEQILGMDVDVFFQLARLLSGK